jgi:hypothetical protein
MKGKEEKWSSRARLPSRIHVSHLFYFQRVSRNHFSRSRLQLGRTNHPGGRIRHQPHPGSSSPIKVLLVTIALVLVRNTARVASEARVLKRPCVGYQLRVIYRGRAHRNSDRNAQCLIDEAAAGNREMIVIVLTDPS